MKSPYKTLIIDDESLARERLKLLLSDYSNYFDIIDEASNGDEAFVKIENLKPELVFLDIQMPGKNVFEMLSELSSKPIVVFCTAYDQYALQAFDSLSIDYLLKPIEKERIETTISKLNHLIHNDQINEVLNILQSNKSLNNYPTSIPHKIGDRIVLVKISDITHFETDKKYTDFYDVKSNKYITEQTLQNLEKILPPNFLRVSKSVIVNFSFVKEFHKYFRGKYVLVMDDLKRSKIISGACYRDKINNKFSFKEF